MSKILITGGAGFIGSHLTALLLNQGFSVTVVDNFSYGKRKFLPENSSDLKILEADILDFPSLQKIFVDFQPETVYHLAAIHHIPTCEKNPVFAFRTNIEGTENVVLAAQSAGIKKMVFASSGAIYDTVDQELIEDETPIIPYDIYSITKRCGEDIIRLYAARKVFKAVACRLFNTVGSHETNAHLVPDILQQVLTGKTDISLGNLTPLRSYIHVLDVAEAFVTVGKKEFSNDFEVLNVGTETEHAVTDILRLISEITGKQLSAVQDPERIRKVDRHRQRASVEKINRLTSWKARKSLREALEDAYREALHV